MNCERARSLIDAYTTDELDLAAALEVEEHLKECPACARGLESLHSLRQMITSPTLRFAAPPTLRRRILADVNPVNVQRGPAPRAGIRRFALAASIGALVLLPWLA